MLVRVPLAQRPLSPRLCAGHIVSVYSKSLSPLLKPSAAQKQSPAIASIRSIHSTRLDRRTPSALTKAQHVQIRHATNLASRTAINPPSNVPLGSQQLYASLDRLKETASDYVNQSRLQLALRGLESPRPTVRIGLLGLGQDGDQAARKLAQVLLADALGDEAHWERMLKQGSTDGKPLLLR